MSECELCGAPLYSDTPGFCGHCKELEERADSGERPGVSRPVEPSLTGGLTPRRSPVL